MNGLHDTMPRLTLSSKILRALAEERRTVVADWRVHLVYDRIARRENYVPPVPQRVRAVLSTWVSDSTIAAIDGVPGVYRITIPYASTIPVPAEAIVQECSPGAALSCLSAFAFHGLIDEIPASVQATRYPGSRVRLPLGTSPEDWADIPQPKQRQPRHVEGRHVEWMVSKPAYDFGHLVGQVEGALVYVTDLERTLLDSLRFPDRFDGLLRVVRAWRRAADDIDVGRILDYAEMIGQQIVRQRVGYVLERLGIRHARLDEWARHAVRGGSAKLVAARAFTAEHSERWSLSMNVPPHILAELEDG